MSKTYRVSTICVLEIEGAENQQQAEGIANDLLPKLSGTKKIDDLIIDWAIVSNHELNIQGDVESIEYDADADLICVEIDDCCVTFFGSDFTDFQPILDEREANYEKKAKEELARTVERERINYEYERRNNK